jgi:CubicO group peptidase (beta-lactamase class C family)
MMVSDGKMRWDDRMTTYLPSFRLYDPVANSELTLRDALSHRSGLSRGDLSWIAAGNSRDDMLRRVRYLRPSWPFRSRWGYQNIMFLAAGEAAAKAGGSTWEDLIQQRIFTPLGMASSVPVAREPDKLTNFATSHGQIRDSVFAVHHMNIDNMAPAGAIVSSARDMAQYLRFQLGDGSFGGKRLVSTAALRETHTPQMIAAGEGAGVDSLTNFSTYGFGWFVQDYRHTLVWQHGGNTDGMTTAMGLLPEQKFGVVVLSNMNGSPLPGLLMRWLFDRQLGAPMRDLSGETLSRIAIQRRRADSLEKVQLAGRPATAPQLTLPLAGFAGTYADSLYGDATVALEGNRLVMTRGEWKAPLEYAGMNTFKWGPLATAILPSFIVKFDVAADNSVTSLSYGIPTETVTLARKATPAGRGGRP